MDRLLKHFNVEHSMLELKSMGQWEERLNHLKSIKKYEFLILTLIMILFSFIFFDNQEIFLSILLIYLLTTGVFGYFFKKIIRKHKEEMNRFLLQEKLESKGIEVRGILDYEKELERLPINKDDNHIYLSNKLENIYYVLVNHKLVPYTFILFKKFYQEIKHCKTYKNVKQKDKKSIETNIELGYKLKKDNKELYMYQISNQIKINKKTLNDTNIINGFIFLIEKPKSLENLDKGYYINENYSKNITDFKRKDISKTYFKKIYGKNNKSSKTENICLEEVDFEAFDKNELLFIEDEATIKGGLDIKVNSFGKLPKKQKEIFEKKNFLMVELSENHLMCYYEIDREKELFYGYDELISLEENKQITKLESAINLEIIETLYTL